MCCGASPLFLMNSTPPFRSLFTSPPQVSQLESDLQVRLESVVAREAAAASRLQELQSGLEEMRVRAEKETSQEKNLEEKEKQVQLELQKLTDKVRGGS